MKSKNNHNHYSKNGGSNHKGHKNYGYDCDCVNFKFNKDLQLVCQKCGRPMKSQKKPLTSKGMKYKQGLI